MKVLAAIIGLAFAVPAVAQDRGRIDTPSGPAVLTVQGTDLVLSIAGQEFLFEGMLYSSFADRLGDVVLIQLSSGGNACPATYAWLDTRPGSIRLTDEFGTCSDLHEISWDAETVTVSMPSMVPGEGKVAFVWDGKSTQIKEVAFAPAATGLPPGGSPAAWAGRFGAELLAAPEWESLLLDLMGQAALDDARRILQVGQPFTAQGDWLISTGCQPHQCDETSGAVALNLRDGRLIVALWERGIGPRAWGDLSAGIPPWVVAVIVGL
jgi:hypothetical protein